MSLLTDGIETNESQSIEPQASEGAAITTDPTWWWDENTPGTGERPAYLPAKFKTVADAAKSYGELEKLKGSAPSQYDFSQGQGWIEEDYEPFVEMAEFAKSKNVPQEVMDKFLGTVGLYLDEFRTDLSEEKSKLGEKATERLQQLNNWAKSNLSDKAFAALSGTMRTAEAIEALEEIRDKMLNSNTMVPSSNSVPPQAGMTMEEYRSELHANYKKYKEDSHYRKEMERKLEMIVGRK